MGRSFYSERGNSILKRRPLPPFSCQPPVLLNKEGGGGGSESPTNLMFMFSDLGRKVISPQGEHKGLAAVRQECRGDEKRKQPFALCADLSADESTLISPLHLFSRASSAGAARLPRRPLRSPCFTFPVFESAAGRSLESGCNAGRSAGRQRMC